MQGWKSSKKEVYMQSWGIEDVSEYKPKTTLWSDFTIADHFGLSAISGTFNRAFEEWKGDYIYLTELVMVLNWKIWQWYEQNDSYAKLYDALWKKADQYAAENLKGDELKYFLETID